MTDLRKAAQQALEALESRYASGSLERCGDAITALEAALEQQPAEQEPVATVTVMTQGVRKDYSFQALQKLPDGVNNLYTTPPQRKPLTDAQVNECGMCGYVGKDKDKTGQCPKCRWDELRPLTGKAHQKPLTDDQIYEMYNEPRSDAEMLEFARAIEAAHGIKEKNT
jgi:hypothetical protein